ncbi:MAG: outer membrane beta-barrel family protein, partial [Bacteroidota bacterium]
FQTNRNVLLGMEEERSTTVSERDPLRRNHNARLGLDYEINDKTIFGVLLTAYDLKWVMDALNTNELFLNNQLTNVLLSDNQERSQLKNLSTNLNLKHDLSAKASISFDVDYLSFYNDNPTDYTNRLLNAERQFLEESLIRSIKETPLHIWVGKVDYSQQIKEDFKLELGAKMVNSAFDNEVVVETLEDTDWVQDASLTSSSELSEQIFATYASSDWKINTNTNAKVGLRYEYSDSKLDTETEGRVVDRQFGQLFPSVFLSHQFSEPFKSTLSYSRRITRPTFRELAPFVYFFDPNTFFAGNTALQPSLTDAVKLDLNYKSVFFSVEYAVQDSAIARSQQRFDAATGRLFLASENLKDAKTLSFTIGFPIQITDWWNMRTNAIYYRQENNAYLDNQLTQIQQNYFQFNINQSFQLPLNFSAELSGFYIGSRLQGALRFGEMYGLNLGIQKKLGEKGSVLRFNVRDVLNSILLTGNSDIPSQKFAFNNNFDFSQRTFSLSYSTNFGNDKLKAARKRPTGAVEEQRRAS